MFPCSLQYYLPGRFTSGYGSADSLNSAGSGVYENVGRLTSNRSSAEYEDYVNMGRNPPPPPPAKHADMVCFKQSKPEFNRSSFLTETFTPKRLPPNTS